MDKCIFFRHSLSFFCLRHWTSFLWVHVLCLVFSSPSIPTLSEVSLNRLLHTSAPILLFLIHSCGLCPNQLRHSSPGAQLSLCSGVTKSRFSDCFNQIAEGTNEVILDIPVRSLTASCRRKKVWVSSGGDENINSQVNSLPESLSNHETHLGLSSLFCWTEFGASELVLNTLSLPHTCLGNFTVNFVT